MHPANDHNDGTEPLIVKDALLVDFQAIVQAYVAYTTHSESHYLNRYFTNRVYPAYSFAASARQDFITVIDAMSLIDPSGTWLPAFNDQLQTFNEQKDVLDFLYDFFMHVQTDQATVMTERLNKIRAALTTTYSTLESVNSVTKNPPYSTTASALRVEYASYSLLRNQDEHAILLAAAHPEQDLPLDNVSLNSDTNSDIENALPVATHSLKYTYDQALAIKQWQQDAARIKALLKSFKKKIHHLAQALNLPCHLKKKANDSTENTTMLWQDAYTLESTGYTRISLEKQQKRTQQVMDWRIGTAAAVIIGIGEGAVAVTGLSDATTLSPLAIMLIVGTSGWYINYLLFKGDIRDCLDEFFINKTLGDQAYSRLFIDQNKQPLSFVQKNFTRTFAVFCAVVGFVFAALSFVSSQEQFPKLIEDFKAPFSLDPIGLTVLAAIPAISVGIGFTAIFFRAIAELIKDQQWQQLGTLLQSLLHPAWQEMTANERMQHVINATLKISMMAIAIAITGLVAFFSFPIFKKDCGDLMATLGDAGVWNPILAFAATLTNNIVSIPFQIKAPYEILNGLMNTENTFAAIPSNDQVPELSVIQRSNQRIQYIKIALAILTGLINAIGQGFLFMNSDSPALIGTSVSMAAAFSFFPNIRAAIIEITRHHDHLMLSPATITQPNSSVIHGLGSQRGDNSVSVRLGSSRSNTSSNKTTPGSTPSSNRSSIAAFHNINDLTAVTLRSRNDSDATL